MSFTDVHIETVRLCLKFRKDEQSKFYFYSFRYSVRHDKFSNSVRYLYINAFPKRHGLTYTGNTHNRRKSGIC